MSYATVTLTGKVTSPTGAASRSGFSIIANTPRVVDAAGKVVLAGAVAIQPDATGAFSVALPATDDANLTPTGFQYRILGHHGIDTTFSLPAALGTVDLAELVAVDPVDVPLADGAVTLFPRLPAVAATDGQMFEWDAPTGRLVAVNPIGQSELAAAENITSTGTSLSASGGQGTIVAIPGTVISISNSNGRPVSLEYEAHFNQTVAGAGSVILAVYETTSTPTMIAFTTMELRNSVAAGQAGIVIPARHKRIGVVSSTRTFELRAYLFALAANSPAGAIANQPLIPTVLRAVAG